MKMQSDRILERTVEMMDRQLLHLVRLVDDLMDVSRVSRGVIELRSEPIAIADVLRAASKRRAPSSRSEVMT